MANGEMEEMASMTMNNGRATLDCEIFDSHRRSSGPEMPIDTAVIVNDNVTKFQDMVVVDLARPNRLQNIDGEKKVKKPM